MSKQEVRLNKVRHFSRERDFASPVIVILHNININKLGQRHDWVCIKNLCNNKTIFRRIRGISGKESAGLTAKMAELDYDSCRELGVNGHESCEQIENLTVTRCNLWQKFLAHTKHPEIEYRTPFQIAMISFATGVLGLVISIIGLFK